MKTAAPLKHDLPLSLVEDAAIVMLADCWNDPDHSGQQHVKAMKDRPELLAGYLISTAKTRGASMTPDSQEASEAVTVDQEMASTARVMMRSLERENPAASKGLEQALRLTGLDPVEFQLNLSVA